MIPHASNLDSAAVPHAGQHVGSFVCPNSTFGIVSFDKTGQIRSIKNETMLKVLFGQTLSASSHSLCS